MPTTISPDQLHTVVAPGQTVFLPGSAGAPLAFVDDLLQDPQHSAGLEIVTSYVPGINALDLDRLDATACVSGLFMQPSFGNAQREGRYRHLPMTYAGFVRHVRDEVVPDLAVVQVAPPDANGRCSLGPAVEFMPEVLKKAMRLVGIINPRVPPMAGAVSIAYESFTTVCEVDSALPTYATDSDPATEAIATNLAGLIPDGAALQVGLGKVPAALSRLLRNHRKLRLHSGMLSDGLLELAEAGVLDHDFAHTTCVLIGSEHLYRELPRYDKLRVVGCEITHDLATLMNTPGLVAVNSALEVDLFGQCNLEHANGRAVSGCGGAPDFARGARMAPGGLSVVALNAQFTSKGKAATRILPTLSTNAVASLSRVDVDVVVTEFGVARLRGRSVHERAQALIGVAAPEFRAELQAAWDAIAAKL